MAGYPHPFAYQGAVNYGNARRRRRLLTGLGDGAGLPGGSRLSYTATWPDTKAQLKTPDAVQMQIQSPMSQQDLVVIDGQYHSQSDYFNFSGSQTMTLQVHTLSDRNAASDVQAIIDGWIYKATGTLPRSSIQVVSVASGPQTQWPTDTGTPPPGPKPPVDLGQWLSDNWIWLALGLGAAVVAEDVL